MPLPGESNTEPVVEIPIGQAERIAYALSLCRGVLKSLEAIKAHMTQDPEVAGEATRCAPLTEYVIRAEEEFLGLIEAAMPRTGPVDLIELFERAGFKRKDSGE
jgi:hypothetical protein